MDEPQTSLREMIGQKPVSYESLVYLTILNTSMALTEGGDKAERAVRSFRPLLLIQADDEYTAGYLLRDKQLRTLKSRYAGLLDQQQYLNEAYPIILEEYEQLIALARRRGLLKVGRVATQTVGESVNE